MAGNARPIFILHGLGGGGGRAGLTGETPVPPLTKIPGPPPANPFELTSLIYGA